MSETDFRDAEANVEDQIETKQPPESNAVPTFSINPIKVAIFVGCVTLCSLSFTVILISQKSEPFFVPMTQFSGDIQLDELDHEVLQWDNSYSDMSSEQSVALIAKLKEKLQNTLKNQGVAVDSVEITSLQPSAPKNISKTVLTEPKSRLFSDEELMNYFYDKDPMELLHASYSELEYNDISTVDIQYTTYGKPNENALLFGSAAGKWGTIQHNVEYGLANDGLKCHITGMQPSNSYMSTVMDGINNYPNGMMTYKQDPIHYNEINCDYTGKELRGKNFHALCTSSCPKKKKIYGGGYGIFSYQTSVCAAAHYLGLTEFYGGEIEVISLGVGRVMAGEKRGNYETNSVEIDFPIFFIKESGDDVVRPDEALVELAPPAGESLDYFYGEVANPSCQCLYNRQIVQIKFEALKLLGKEITYTPIFSNQEVEQSKKYLSAAGEAAVHAARMASLDHIDCFEVNSIENPFHDGDKGILYDLALCGDPDKAVVDINTNGMYNLALKIQQNLNPEDGIINVLAIRFTGLITWEALYALQ